MTHVIEFYLLELILCLSLHHEVQKISSGTGLPE